MIISHRHRFVFVEIPHTASHSIAQELIANYGGEPILRKHANVTQFLAQASRPERHYFKFATVRNPLDSAATDFAKLKSNHKGQFTNPSMLLENGGHITKDHLKEFRFIEENDADFASFFRVFRAKLYNNWFLVGDRHFDYVIRFERLQEGFTEVLSRLGIDQVSPIPHVNRTKGKERSWEEYYTSDIVDLAVACFGPFMEKWGYPIPSDWGAADIPFLSRLQFTISDTPAQFAARFLTLDPNHPLIHRAKRALDFATRRKS